MKASNIGIINTMMQQGNKFLGYSAGCVGLADVAFIAGSSKSMMGWFQLNERDLIRTILNNDEKFVSLQAAKQYAGQAVAFADMFSQDGVLGVGITASVKSDYEKRSPDEAWIVVAQQSREVTTTVHVIFGDSQNRSGQNEVITDCAVWAMGRHLNIIQDSLESWVGTSQLRVEVETWTRRQR